MADVFQPPKFSVVVWVRKTDNYGTIRSKLLELAAAEPDVALEYEGMMDFHWGSIGSRAHTKSPWRFGKSLNGPRSLSCGS